MAETQNKPLSDEEKQLWDSILEASLRQGKEALEAANAATDVIRARRAAFEGAL